MLRPVSLQRRVSSSTSLQAPSDMTVRKIRETCMIPTVSSVSKCALRAMEEGFGQHIPYGLSSAKRAEVLAQTEDNNVPESIITESMLSDRDGRYLEKYHVSAKRILKDACILSAKIARKTIIDCYWDYLCDSSGFPVTVEYAGRDKRMDSRRSAAVIMLYPSHGSKLLSKRPFSENCDNLEYRKIRKDMVSALDAVQMYGFYMRPDDPMSRSEDTRVRLEEIIKYVHLLYRSLSAFMDKFDLRVIKSYGLCPGSFGCREEYTPDELFEQYLRCSSRPVIPGGMAALMRLINDAIISVIKMCSLFRDKKWKRGSEGTEAAIISAVDFISVVHHHCCYLINLTMTGYACWLEGGIKDKGILGAIRRREKFCRFFNNLAPTVATHSWAEMEMCTEKWFKMAIAAAIMKHGGPTRRYLCATGHYNKSVDNEYINRDDVPKESTKRLIKRNRPASVATCGLRDRRAARRLNAYADIEERSNGLYSGALFLGSKIALACSRETDDAVYENSMQKSSGTNTDEKCNGSSCYWEIDNHNQRESVSSGLHRCAAFEDIPSAKDDSEYRSARSPRSDIRTSFFFSKRAFVRDGYNSSWSSRSSSPESGDCRKLPVPPQNGHVLNKEPCNYVNSSEESVSDYKNVLRKHSVTKVSGNCRDNYWYVSDASDCTDMFTADEDNQSDIYFNECLANGDENIVESAYVTMEEIEKRRSEIKEGSGIGPKGRRWWVSPSAGPDFGNYMYLRGDGKLMAIDEKHVRLSNLLYDSPRDPYDVPYGTLDDKSSAYDVPRNYSENIEDVSNVSPYDLPRRKYHGLFRRRSR